MPRRTVTVEHLYSYVRGEPDRRSDLDSLPMGDLLYASHALFAQMPREHLVDLDGERYVSIENMHRRGRTLLFELSAGPLGEAGEVRNSSTHEVEHEYDVSSARTVTLHAMLVVPKRSRSALFFIEHGTSAASGSAVRTALIRAMRSWHPGLIPRSEQLVEAAAWLKGAELVRATALVYGHSPNLEDHIGGLPKILGRLEHRVLPERGQRALPRVMYDRLVARTIDRSAVFGISTDEEISDVTVTMTNNGREKTFALGEERSPTLRLLLTEAGQSAPTTADFRGLALSEAPDLFGSVGVDWHTGDAEGDWPSEADEVIVELPPP